jgi:hypothetical protein
MNQPLKIPFGLSLEKVMKKIVTKLKISSMIVSFSSESGVSRNEQKIGFSTYEQCMEK